MIQLKTYTALANVIQWQIQIEEDDSWHPLFGSLFNNIKKINV